MAIKIIKHGNKYNVIKRFVCTSCWCEFEADATDCFTEPVKSGFTVRYMTACPCPECRQIVTEYE